MITLRNSLKLLGLAPILIYFMINGIFSLTIGAKIPLLIIVAIISVGSLFVRHRLGDKVSQIKLVMLSVSLVITILVFGYFINAV